MSSIRKILASALVVSAAMSLTACSQHNPGVTVWSGTTSAHREALCWSADAAVTADNCAQDIVTGALTGPDMAEIPVRKEQTIGVSVDPIVAEKGWYIVIGGTRINENPITSTYYRFSFPVESVPEEGYALQVVAQGTGNATRGLWLYKLVSEK